MQNRERSFGGIVPRKSTSLTIRSHDEDESTISVALKSSLSGLLSFIGCGLVLISVAAVVAYSNADPDAIISPISLAALFPAAFAGGFTTVKRTGGSPLLCGVLCGGIITIFSIVASLLLRGTISSGYELWQASILHGATVLFSTLGSFAGNAKRKVNPRKHRRFK